MAKACKENKSSKVKEKKEKKQKKNSVNTNPEEKITKILFSPVKVLVVLTLVCACFGAALLYFYTDYSAYMDFIIGGIICLAGLVSILFYFLKKTIDGVYRTGFATGILCIALGVFIALNGKNYYTFLVIIGLILAIDGVLKLQFAMDIGRMGYRKWWILLIISVLGLAIGVVMMMNLIGEIFGSAEEIQYSGYAVCANALLDIISLIIIAIGNRRISLGLTRKPQSVDVVIETPYVEPEQPEDDIDLLDVREEDSLEAAPEIIPEVPEETAVLPEEAAATEFPEEAAEASEEISDKEAVCGDIAEELSVEAPAEEIVGEPLGESET